LLLAEQEAKWQTPLNYMPLGDGTATLAE